VTPSDAVLPAADAVGHETARNGVREFNSESSLSSLHHNKRREGCDLSENQTAWDLPSTKAGSSSSSSSSDSDKSSSGEREAVCESISGDNEQTRVAEQADARTLLTANQAESSGSSKTRSSDDTGENSSDEDEIVYAQHDGAAAPFCEAVLGEEYSSSDVLSVSSLEEEVESPAALGAVGGSAASPVVVTTNESAGRVAPNAANRAPGQAAPRVRSTLLPARTVTSSSRNPSAGVSAARIVRTGGGAAIRTNKPK
jgi:hypothetical protein